MLTTILIIVLVGVVVLFGTFGAVYRNTISRRPGRSALSKGEEGASPQVRPAARATAPVRPAQPPRPTAPGRRSAPAAPPSTPAERTSDQLAADLEEGVPVTDEAIEAELLAGLAADEAALAPPSPGPEVIEEGTISEADLEELLRPRFRDRLGKARSLFSGYLGGIRGRGRVDDETWDDLEEALILADVGVDTTQALLDELRGQAKANKISEPDELIEAFKADLVERLQGDRELHFAEEDGRTTVWLFVGVNGVGKTTTIGKVALHQRSEGREVVMAAGDTFRAAAADQLAQWARRVGAEVVRGNEGGDPGAVVFDAVQHASARKVPLVLADTAGRLHTKVNLMEELKKVRRVAERPPGLVTEVLLVIDATTGQNGLIQAKQFAAAVGVTGVVLTKLDGTAKGGIAVAIATELGLPIKLIGLGEKAGDLVSFDPVEFVEALVAAD